jgi:hypothetical protein
MRRLSRGNHGRDAGWLATLEIGAAGIQKVSIRLRGARNCIWRNSGRRILPLAAEPTKLFVEFTETW